MNLRQPPEPLPLATPVGEMGKNAAMRTWLRDHGLLLANLGAVRDLFRRHGPVRGQRLQRRADRARRNPPSPGGTWHRATSSRRPSRTGRASSCRWACTSSSPCSCSRGLLGVQADRRAAPAGRGPPLIAGQAGRPWPVRRGGWVLKLYENSLAIMFFVLFLASCRPARRWRREGLQREQERARGSRSSHAGSTSAPRSSGSSRSRTGRASSSRSPRSCRRLGLPASARLPGVQAGRRTAHETGT